ncbi:MAG TPA: T9SS type A sorting domain-containing protein, partial [Bacteroidetes bacterium]|nr:T9SS type A sorting domain-containing protein [Bacteroidota bacterium]
NATVLLRTGATYFYENIKDYEKTATIGKQEMVGGHYYRLLQFYELPSERQLAEIAKNGIQLLEYIPHNTYLAAIPVEFEIEKFKQLNVRSIQPIPQKLKTSAAIQNGEIPEWAKAKNRAFLKLKFYKNLPHELVARFCEADGIKIVATNHVNNFLRVSVATKNIGKTAALPYVAYLGFIPPPALPDDLLARSLHRSNAIDAAFPTGRKYDGKGVGVLCRDDGFVGPHIDFKGRIDDSSLDDPNPLVGDHGDGVSGIICGAGNLNPHFKGMASGSDLFVLDYEPDFLDETMSLHFTKNVLVTNSSYSNGCNAGYTDVTETVDQQLFQNPTLMHVFSAGNSNNQDCGFGAGGQWGNITGGHKQAKNCITVANLDAEGGLVNTSSRGPAHDGRIKPDIAANGAGQVSTKHGNSYQIFGGTSAAAPGIAGIMAQMHQAYREANEGQIAEAALLKSCLLNSADDLGNIGPDFKFGWGQVNALRAVWAVEENRFFKDEVSPGETKTYHLQIPENTVQARVMLYWNDPEATLLAGKALVNDLDCWMSKNSSVYRPWVLDISPNEAALNSPAARGIDTLNNMEQIAIDHPAPGDFLLNVRGKELPFGAHPFYVVWEFRTQEITLTHPFGGESFSPGDTLRVHWDAATSATPFSIAYSTDGGENFTEIATVEGNKKMWDWAMPANLTGQVFLKITNPGTGFFSQNEVPFSVAPVPQNLQVSRACPDHLEVTWSPVSFASANSNVEYEIYLLGERYMESLGLTSDLHFEVPTISGNPTLDHWLAIRAVGENGLKSGRSVALLYNGGLKNCAQQNDLSILKILSPGTGTLSGCGTFGMPVSITLKNTGTASQTDISVGYQINGGPPVLETLPGTMQPGQVTNFIFSNPLEINGLEKINLRSFTALPSDQAFFNDEKEIEFEVAIYPGTGEILDFAEGFESGVFPPGYFIISNPDERKTWEQTEAIGSDGQPTNCSFLNNYFYNAVGEEDAFLTVPIDLEGAEKPVLSFDLAYAPYNPNYADGLRVEISANCGGTFTETVFEKQGEELGTAASQSNLFAPHSAADWEKIDIDLSAYTGHSIVAKFTNINGWGNAIYLDNIEVKEEAAPNASSEIIPKINASISPNPAADFFDLNIWNDKNEAFELAVFSTQGRIYFHKKMKVVSGQNLFAVDVKDFPPGLYFLEIKGENGVRVLKVVVN